MSWKPRSRISSATHSSVPGAATAKHVNIDHYCGRFARWSPTLTKDASSKREIAWPTLRQRHPGHCQRAWHPNWLMNRSISSETDIPQRRRHTMIHLWLMKVMVKMVTPRPATVEIGCRVLMKGPVEIFVIAVGDTKSRTKRDAIDQGIHDERQSHDGAK